MRKLLYLFGMIFLSACAVLTGRESLPAPQSFPVHSRSISEMQNRLDSTNIIANGVVTKVQRNWDFEDKCGILTRIRYGCVETSAWEITIKGNQNWQIMAFSPHGDFLPIAKGMEAIFLLRSMVVTEIGKCTERQGLSSAASCQTWNVPVIADTLDIYPRADSTLIDSLWAAAQSHKHK